jgi:nicotinate-nucleotide pyrophosphorylase (carboxylating)
MNDLKRFLEEDIGSGDVTTELIIGEEEGKAEITCEDDAVVAGLYEAAEIFKIMGLKTHLYAPDGAKVKKGTRVAVVSGSTGSILTAERTALNIMMRMSGVATMTNDIVSECRKADPKMIVAGTRKTTPGFRRYEKKAIILGGGDPHRYGLYDQVLIKDNHIKAAGGVLNAIQRAKNVPRGMKIEVEVESMADAVIAAENGADMILIDNKTPAETRKIRDRIKSIDPKIIVEASGRITADNAKQDAGCADMISLGALTHSVKAVHFSLNFL